MRVKEPSTKIIFVRHGSTDYPEDKIYKDENGPHLNREGKAQAREMARWLQEETFSTILVSPSNRTVETASIIAKALNMDYEIWDNLKERSFGIWEGLTFKEIETHYKEGLMEWKKDPVHYAPEGGETIVDLQQRISDVISCIIQKFKGTRILIVTHMGPIRVAVAQALSIPLINYRHLQIHPGSATRIDYGITAANLVYLGVLPGKNKP